MSFIVKGIDMPKELSISLDIWSDGTVRIANERMFKGQAIQIPKGHGRLIDERELSDRLLDIPHYTVNIHQVPTGVFRDADVLPEVRHSPTILEAEDD